MNWNDIITAACLITIIGLLYVVALMLRAIRRDVKQMEQDRERELEDWKQE